MKFYCTRLYGTVYVIVSYRYVLFYIVSMIINFIGILRKYGPDRIG